VNSATICDLFDYQDGVLLWRTKPCKNISIGSPAGTPDKDGYITIRYQGKHYKAHRLVYALFNDSYPECIDHIDRNRSNNKIENLRGVSRLENMQNVGMYSNNKSGYKHIRWYKQTNRWAVMVKRKHIGYFKDLSDAKDALHKYTGENNE
jgi:hypothetical protein